MENLSGSIVFSTSRLHLKRFSHDDINGFFELNNDLEVLQYTGDKPFLNLEQVKVFIDNYNHYDLYDYGRWSVYIKDTNQYIGFCGLKYSEEKEEVDIGFRIMKKFWNHGYATEAALGCIEYAKQKNITTLIARANQKNLSSLRVIEKLNMIYSHNFVEEGAIWKQYQLPISF